MSKCWAMVVTLSILVGGIFPVGIVHADWQSDLQRQLEREYNCEIAFLSHLEVRKVDGREVVFVRANCTDKRAFEARRDDPSKPFKIEACDVQAC